MDDPLFITKQKPGYKLVIQLTELDRLNEENDNVDVNVYFDEGPSYSATFFTLKNIQALMERYKSTRECLSGLYFYSSDLIIVERLTIENIEQTVSDLIDNDEVRSSFKQLKA